MTQPNERKLLFLYLDIDHATEYKYQQHPEEWKTAFEFFFEDFPDYLKEAQQTLFGKFKTPLEPMNFWKALGDGQVYNANFQTADQAYLYTKAFYNATVLFNGFFSKRFGLYVKAAGWYASLPKINLCIQTPAGEDYLGPDLDIGFRLAAEALSQRMILAMDLAYELSYSSYAKEMDFYHLGWRKLKGVAKDKPYPILMITGRNKPELPIWETYLNDLTQAYINGEPISAEGLRNLIDRYKKDLHFNATQI